MQVALIPWHELRRLSFLARPETTAGGSHSPVAFIPWCDSGASHSIEADSHSLVALPPWPEFRCLSLPGVMEAKAGGSHSLIPWSECRWLSFPSMNSGGSPSWRDQRPQQAALIPRRLSFPGVIQVRLIPSKLTRILW